MIHYLFYNTTSGKFEEIISERVSEYSIVLELNTGIKTATMYVLEDVGMIARRTAQRMADSITRSGFDHSEASRIGEGFYFELTTISNMSEISISLNSNRTNDRKPNQRKTDDTAKSQKSLIDKLSDTVKSSDLIREDSELDSEENQTVVTNTSKVQDFSTDHNFAAQLSDEHLEELGIEEPFITDEEYFTFTTPLMASAFDPEKHCSFLADGKFKAEYRKTVGMEPFSKYIRINNLVICISLIQLYISERTKSIISTFLRGSMMVLLYYSPENNKSIADIEYVANSLPENTNDLPIAIIKHGNGNAIDDLDIPKGEFTRFYEIDDEEDPKQFEILEEMAKLVLQKRKSL